MALVGLAPLMFLQCMNLWQRPHYQFFPIAWAAFVIFTVFRSEVATSANPLRIRIGLILVVLALVLLIVAATIFSPWLAHIATILVCLGWMLVRLADTPWTSLLARSSLLVVTIPLPQNLDAGLIQGLQAWSTRSTSHLLDLFSTPHLASGNIIQIRTGELFVEEACSGVDSLYALAAVLLLLTLSQKNSFLVSMLAFLSVPIWAWLGNVFRLTVIAMMLDRYGIDLSQGWQHTLLGIAIFGCSLACLLQTLAAIKLLLAPFSIMPVMSSGIHDAYNFCVTWPQKLSAGRIETEAPVARPIEPVPSRVAKPAILVVGAAFVLAGIASCLPIMGLGAGRRFVMLLPSYSELQVADALTEDDLPRSLAGWTRGGFERVQRSAASAFGEHSVIWEFSLAGRTCLVSVDFPFNGFHPLETCYEGTGNRVALIEQAESVITEVQLEGQLETKPYLCFMVFEADGTHVPRPDLLSSPLRRLKELRQQPVSYQIQVFAEGDEVPTEAERREVRELLKAAFAALQPSIAELADLE